MGDTYHYFFIVEKRVFYCYNNEVKISNSASNPQEVIIRNIMVHIVVNYLQNRKWFFEQSLLVLWCICNNWLLSN